MRVVVQRSKYSSVTVDGKIVGQIDNGLVLLVGITKEDTLEDLEYMAKKVLNLRIFDDSNGIMNKSILDNGGSILSISQLRTSAISFKAFILISWFLAILAIVVVDNCVSFCKSVLDILCLFNSHSSG